MTLYAILYYGKQDRPQFYLKAQWAVSIHKYCSIIVKSKAFNVIISEFKKKCTFLDVLQTVKVASIYIFN